MLRAVCKYCQSQFLTLPLAKVPTHGASLLKASSAGSASGLSTAISSAQGCTSRLPPLEARAKLASLRLARPTPLRDRNNLGPVESSSQGGRVRADCAVEAVKVELNANLTAEGRAGVRSKLDAGMVRLPENQHSPGQASSSASNRRQVPLGVEAAPGAHHISRRARRMAKRQPMPNIPGSGVSMGQRKPSGSAQQQLLLDSLQKSARPPASKAERSEEARALVRRALSSATSIGELHQVASDRAGQDVDELLDTAYNQCPRPRRDLDWSAATDSSLSAYPSWSTKLATGDIEPVTIQRDGELLSVTPMWICVHQEEELGLARLYESAIPLDGDIVDALEQQLPVLVTVDGLCYRETANESSGAWHNFFIGVYGGVAADDVDTMWPNQIIHGDRTMYNVRNGLDVARFLAKPTKEDIEGHTLNLRRLQEERKYRGGWLYHMLQSRWGLQALQEHGYLPSEKEAKTA